MKHIEAITLIHQAVETASKQLSLSPLPADGLCPLCGHHVFSLYEAGHSRTTTLQLVNENDWLGMTSGFDDYTDIGQTEMLVCFSCDEVFTAPTPENIDWA